MARFWGADGVEHQGRRAEDLHKQPCVEGHGLGAAADRSVEQPEGDGYDEQAVAGAGQRPKGDRVAKGKTPQQPVSHGEDDDAEGRDGEEALGADGRLGGGGKVAVETVVYRHMHGQRPLACRGHAAELQAGEDGHERARHGGGQPCKAVVEQGADGEGAEDQQGHDVGVSSAGAPQPEEARGHVAEV